MINFKTIISYMEKVRPVPQGLYTTYIHLNFHQENSNTVTTTTAENHLQIKFWHLNTSYDWTINSYNHYHKFKMLVIIQEMVLQACK
jgi:hypothetical protein